MPGLHIDKVGGGEAIVVKSIADLSAHPTEKLKDGSKALVKDLAADFFYDKDAGTGNGPDDIAPDTGVGYWIKIGASVERKVNTILDLYYLSTDDIKDGEKVFVKDTYVYYVYDLNATAGVGKEDFKPSSNVGWWIKVDSKTSWVADPTELADMDVSKLSDGERFLVKSIGKEFYYDKYAFSGKNPNDFAAISGFWIEVDYRPAPPEPQVFDQDNKPKVINIFEGSLTGGIATKQTVSDFVNAMAKEEIKEKELLYLNIIPLDDFRPLILEHTLTATTGLYLNPSVKSDIGAGSLIVDWGDGSVEEFGENTYPTHTYASEGVYDVTFKAGKLNIMYSWDHTASALTTLTRIKQFGDPKFNYFTYWGCENLTEITATDYPDLSSLTSLANMFRSTALTAIPANLLETASNATSLSYAFSGTNITEVPAGLFDKCTQNTSFWSTFEGCSSLTTIPTGLFDYNTEVTSFDSTFHSADLSSIPGTLFWENTKVTTFRATFLGNSRISYYSYGLFTQNTEVTNFQHTFNGCALTYLPYMGFEYNTKVTTFESCFANNEIEWVDPDTFTTNTLCTNFYNTFYNNKIDTTYDPIPEDFFSYCTYVTDFRGVFEFNLIKDIPAGLFSGAYNATTVGSALKDNQLTSIPATLFDNCYKLTGYSRCFENNNITAIPETFKFQYQTKWLSGVFDNNNLTSIPANLLADRPFVEDVSWMFKDNPITSIPAGLFSDSPAITNFDNAFSGCTALTEVPAGLFDVHTSATDFFATFSGCSNLVTVPSNLFDNTIADRLPSVFSGCTSLALAPEIWNTFPTANGNRAFYQCTAASNYASIPDNWKL
jgi:hypothetical protein